MEPSRVEVIAGAVTRRFPFRWVIIRTPNGAAQPAQAAHPRRGVPRSEEGDELGDGQAGVADERAERPWLDRLGAVNRDGERPGPALPDKDVVGSRDACEGKAGLSESLHGSLPGD